MAVEDGSFAPNDEVDELRWLGRDDALGTLSYVHDRELVAGALGPGPTRSTL